MDCRMNGLGVFGTLGLGPLLFTELGADIYLATDKAVRETGMDRLSFDTIAAVGVRGFPGWVVRPLVQAGLGLEVSHLSWNADGAELTSVHPLGFVGTGAEVAVGDSLRLGLNLRLYLMAAFQPVLTVAAYDGGASARVTGDAVMSAAGQLQLWARFDF
jgi:hypothetical protein